MQREKTQRLARIHRSLRPARKGGRTRLSWPFLSPLVGVVVAMTASLIGGCTPVGMAIGAGATVANSASEERGLDGTATDTLLDAEIRTALDELGHGLLSDLGVTVRERRVLLTGRVASADDHRTVIDVVRNVAKVGEIYDAISEGKAEDLASAARDRLIAEGLANDLLFDSVIKSVNYIPVVSHRIVYVMGVAQDQQELDRVMIYARNTAYVRGVVSLVMMRDDPRRLAPNAVVNQVVVTPVVYRPSAAPGGVYRVVPAPGRS